MDKREMLDRIAALEHENARLKASKGVTIGGVTFRVSKKAGVSVYGLGRYPVSLYRSQWERLFGAIEDLKAFIAEHSAVLATKPTKDEVAGDAEPETPETGLTESVE